MGLNNNGPSRPLAQWAVRFLGRAVGRGLFDDPYAKQIGKKYQEGRNKESSQS